MILHTHSSTKQKHTLHFDLSHHQAEGEPFLSVALQLHLLREHNDRSRQRFKAENGFLSQVPDEKLTHYIEELELSTESVGMLSVVKKVMLDDQEVEALVSLALAIPQSSFQAFAAQQGQLPTTGVHPKLARMGVNEEIPDFETSRELLDYHLQAHHFNDLTETAVALMFQHNDIMHLDGRTQHPAWIYQNLGLNNRYLYDLQYILMDQGENWSTVKKMLDEEGKEMPDPFDESRFCYTRKFHPEVMGACRKPLHWAITECKNAEVLRDQKWGVRPGITSATYGAHSDVPGSHKPELPENASKTRWRVKEKTPNCGLYMGHYGYDEQSEVLTVTAKNWFLRHLGAYVQFLDATGQPIDLTEWKGQWLPKWLSDILEKDPAKRMMGTVSPVVLLCGIPIGPDPKVLDIQVPKNAAYVKVFWGGVGTGEYDAVVCPAGMFLTVVMEGILPVIALIAGDVISNNKWINKVLEDKDTLYGLLSIAGVFATGESVIEVFTMKDIKSVLARIGNTLIPKIITGGLKWVILKFFVEGTAGRIIPYVDEITQVLSLTVSLADLAQTTAEVAASPFVYDTTFTRVLDLTVTMAPDHQYHKFPDLATSYKVVVSYDEEATTPAFEEKVDLSKVTHSKPINVFFKDLPESGKLQVRGFFYAENEWQAGQGESQWVPARGDENHQLAVSFEVTTNPVPLDKNSVYTHKQKIVYAEGKHQWAEAWKKPPTATHLTPPQDPKHVVNALRSITMAQYPAMMAYAWEANGLGLPLDNPKSPPSNETMYTVMNLSILEDPEAAYAHPNVGFSQQTNILYDVSSPEAGGGMNFFIDPSKGNWDGEKNPAGGFHLRRVDLAYGQVPDFEAASGQSWGRFNNAVDRFVVHPKGYVVGIDYLNNKMEILKLPASARKDTDAPFANLYAGEGFREGLLNGPRSMGITQEGRILILENLNNRIQAFDLNGNPVPCFGSGEDKSTWFSLKDPMGSAHYLDIAVESKGYIFVLSYLGDGSNPKQYHMDIYDPQGIFLARTEGMAAAKIAVSILRNVYTLNYEILKAQNNRTEPSVSMWIPPAPQP